MSTGIRSTKQQISGIAALRKRLNAALDTNVGNHPIWWYITGWRGGLIALLLAVIYPQVVDRSLQLTGITVGIYVLLALGLNVVVGYAGLLDLGYVAFFALGAYVQAIGTHGAIKLLDNRVIHIPTFTFWPLLLLGALVAGLFGVLLGAPTLRLRGDYLAIVTLGFGEIIPIIFQQMPFFFGNQGLSAQPPADIGGITFADPENNLPFYYLMLIIIVLVVVMVSALRESSLGRAWVAIREDETAAAASGVNLVRTKLLAFGIGAMVGGIGGVLFAANNQYVNPSIDFNFSISIAVLAMIVLGGLGSIRGVIIGAIVLRTLDDYVLGKISDYVQDPTNHVPGLIAGIDFNTIKPLIFGLALVAMILLRPQGLIPNVRRQRELAGIGVSAEGFSVVGALESEEAGMALSGSGSDNVTQYTGAGSDAQGRDQ